VGCHRGCQGTDAFYGVADGAVALVTIEALSSFGNIDADWNGLTVRSSEAAITVDGSLSAFSTTLGEASTAQTFTTGGKGLNGDILVTAPGQYEVGIDGTTFASSVTLPVLDGSVASTTVYARIAATVDASNPAGQVSIASSGATTQNIAVTGTVSGGSSPYDTWASSFGLDPATDGAPTADPDGDGQKNLFEFIAGVVPNDARSRFHWRVEEDPLNSGQSRIVFSPRFGDRTYNLKTSTTLQVSDWIDFTGGSVIDDGDERTVIDPDTSDASKFYRLEIAKP
jgi:hypothetical protein